MKALILAGGFGTRLRPLSCTRPKILFPIVNKPLLTWSFEKLANSNIDEAILAVDRQTEIFMKQQRIRKCGLHVVYSMDPLRKPLCTGGPIRKAEKLLGHDNPFLVLNGDIFADVDYREILKVHENKKAVATIALHEVIDPSRYGVAELTKEDQIKRFIEKPAREQAPTNLVNAGVYVLSPEIFKHIPKERKVSLEHEVFPELARTHELYGYVFDGLWMDIGKMEDYLKINRVLLDSLSTPQTTRSEVKVRRPVALGKEVSLGEESVIGPYAVLGRDVTVGSSVHIRNSVIFPQTTVSDLSSINGAIIGENVAIGRNVHIGEGCVLGDHVKVKNDVSLVSGVTVCPAKEVSESVLTPKYII